MWRFVHESSPPLPLMSTPAPDYGEPWTYNEDSTEPPITAADGEPIILGAAYEVNEKRLKRATDCTNALSGVHDPEKAIQAAREALEAEEAWRDNGGEDHGILRGIAADKRKLALSLLTSKEAKS